MNRCYWCDGEVFVNFVLERPEALGLVSDSEPFSVDNLLIVETCLRREYEVGGACLNEILDGKEWGCFGRCSSSGESEQLRVKKHPLQMRST